MRAIPMALMLIAGVMLPILSARADDKPDKRDQAVTLPMSVLAEDASAKVFGVPVECNGVTDQFAWKTIGATQISESFARRCKIKVVPFGQDPPLAPEVRQFCAGTAVADVKFAGQSFHIKALVLRDELCQDAERNGCLGFDVASAFQWTWNPAVPAITLRPPGSKPATQPVATAPMRVYGECFWLTVTIRNEPVEVRILPMASCVQADQELQHKWDMSSTRPVEVRHDRFGSVRYIELHGKDTVAIGKDLAETDLIVLLAGNARNANAGPKTSGGLGLNFLNRFVFTVDPQTHQFMVFSRVSPSATRPAGN